MCYFGNDIDQLFTRSELECQDLFEVLVYLYTHMPLFEHQTHAHLNTDASLYCTNLL